MNKRLLALCMFLGMIVGTIGANHGYSAGWQQEYEALLEVYKESAAVEICTETSFLRLFLLRFFTLDLLWLGCFLPFGFLTFGIQYAVYGMLVGAGIAFDTIVYGVFGICFFILEIGMQLLFYMAALSMTRKSYDAVRKQQRYLGLFALAHAFTLFGVCIEYFLHPWIVSGIYFSR